MISDSLLSNDKFWMAIEFIESLGHPILVADIFGQLEIDEEDLTTVLEFLKNFNYQISKDKDTGKMMLYPPDEKQQIIYDFTMPQIYLIRKIEESYAKGRVIQADFFNHAKLSVYVHQLVFIDGELCIVGENIQNKKMGNWPLDEIQAAKIDLECHYRPVYSELEVTDYLKALRSIAENEVRLVLKFTRAQSVEPRFHFLGNPFVTTNWNGEKIWAATVEVSDYLYQWLLSVHDHVEIMDPESVKCGLVEYCQREVAKESKDKSHLKKAS